MISNLGWGTFLLWGLFDAVIAIVTFFLLYCCPSPNIEYGLGSAVLNERLGIISVHGCC
jgi:hypothetical protein